MHTPPNTSRLEADAAGIQFHYDLPVGFFQLFLDPTMSYTCHYFLRRTETLEQAAQNKLALIAKKLQLRPEDRVLDIGCGWGNFLLYGAKEFGCHVTGITLSPSQAQYIATKAAAEGLSDLVRVDVVHADAMPYPSASFTKIVTIGTIEHIDDLSGLFRSCNRLLVDDATAFMLVHGMTCPVDGGASQQPEGALDEEAHFIRDYIFPVGDFTNEFEVVRALETSGFELIDLENIPDHYTLTLRHWLNNLEKHCADLGAETGVRPERFRAQLLFLAGFIEGFRENRILCYQNLVRKIRTGQKRTPLPLTRERLLP